MESVIQSTFDRLPVESFGSDHWSLLAYIETVLVEYGLYDVDLDPHLRTNRRHYRFLVTRHHLAPHLGEKWRVAGPMRPEHGSRVDGAVLPNHDDWDCLEDLIAAGFLTVQWPHNRPAVVLTPLGDRAVAALRVHKREGGRWATFRWPAPPALPPAVREDLPPPGA